MVESILLLKIIIAAVLGMLIGLERTIAGKRAGMRTFALVSVGSALFVIVSNAIVQDSAFDPMRVPAAIVSGIGFLGAGMILLRQDVLRGLTTAAGLWVTAGVGIAVGFGMYYVATFVVLVTLLIFMGVWFLEQVIKSYTRHDTSVIIGEPSQEQ